MQQKKMKVPDWKIGKLNLNFKFEFENHKIDKNQKLNSKPDISKED